MNLRNTLISLLGFYIRHLPTQRFKWRVYKKALSIIAKSKQVVNTTTFSGESLLVPAQDFAATRLVLTGQWEPPVTAVLKALLKNGDTFIDVGANFGYYSIISQNFVGRNGRIFSFECAPRALNFLRENVSRNNLNGRIAIFDTALGNKTGDVSFFECQDDTGWSSLSPVQNSNEITVKVKRLDDIYLEGRAIKLVKIDAEGSEFQILEGMRTLLSLQIPPFVIAEVTPAFAKRGGSTVASIFDLMESFDYSAFSIARLKVDYGPYPSDGIILMRTNATSTDLAGRQEDILFVPRSRISDISDRIPFASFKR